MDRQRTAASPHRSPPDQAPKKEPRVCSPPWLLLSLLHEPDA